MCVFMANFSLCFPSMYLLDLQVGTISFFVWPLAVWSFLDWSLMVVTWSYSLLRVFTWWVLRGRGADPRSCMNQLDRRRYWRCLLGSTVKMVAHPSPVLSTSIKSADPMVCPEHDLVASNHDPNHDPFWPVMSLFSNRFQYSQAFNIDL